MRLDYLNGLEDESSYGNENIGSVDAQDLSLNDDDQELNGKFGKWLKKTAKKVGDKIGDGIRVINRFANPATILLRNGFLLAMKVNMLKVASKLRYGYLTDEQAKTMNMDLDALNKVRAIKDRAETIYWQCGGLRENLKKAILDGKGNSDKKVPMNGLEGLDAVYADEDEYKILKYGNLSGIEELDELGDPASGTALAAATGAVAALAAALKSIKGLFKKDSPEAAEFEDSSTSPTEPPAPMPDLNFEQNTPSPSAASPVPMVVNNKIDFSNQRTAAPQAMQIPSYYTETLPVQQVSSAPAVQQAPTNTTEPTTTPTTTTEPPKEGILTKATNWVKANPIKSVLIMGAVMGTTYLVFSKPKEKPQNNQSKKAQGMNGPPKKGKGKKNGKKEQIKTIKF